MDTEGRIVHPIQPGGRNRPSVSTVSGSPSARHYSPRTEEAYVAWIKRYIFFHGKRHPSEMGAEEVTRFLSSLALPGRVSAFTQNQALSAVLFL